MAAPEKFSDLFDLITALRSGYIRETTVLNTFVPTRKAVLLYMGDLSFFIIPSAAKCHRDCMVERHSQAS